MELTKSDLISIFPCNNNVLLKPLLDTNETQGRSIKMFLDTTWKPEHHSKVLCEVIAMPKQLIFSRKYQEYSMEWDTEMNVKIGEIVMINYLGALNAEKYYHFEHNKEKLYIVPYQRIYMVFRGDDVIMLNGYMLAEKIEAVVNKVTQKAIDAGIVIPDTIDKTEKQKFIVRYLHEPNERYLINQEYDDDIVNVGDVVLTKMTFFKSLENPLHRVFAVDKDLLVIQRKHVVAVFKNHKWK